MEEKKHIPECTGYIEKEKYIFDNNLNVTTKTVVESCLEKIIQLCIDCEYYKIEVGECVFKYFNESELVELLLSEKYKKEIHKFRTNDIPRWDGEDYVWTISYITYGGGWVWCTKTDLSKISNLWLNDLSMELRYYIPYYEKDPYEETLKYLKRQNFVSKRANPYEITTTDINKLITKFKKQIQ